jgi:hypothetical protein
LSPADQLARPDASTMSEHTAEPQYQDCLTLRDRQGLTSLGLMSSLGWHVDPKRLVFTLSRYKFVAKMLSGLASVVEIGSADAFGSRLVRQEVKRLLVTDFDPVFIEDARTRMDPTWEFECEVHNILDGPLPDRFDGAYALDVIEHIPLDQEDHFMRNMTDSLTEHGVLILGSPSLQSQRFASDYSRAGHVNCKDAPEFKALALRYFHNVFIFSMNDEVVHTGFYPMAQYLFAVCCGRR